jgi:hypothetical protein
LWLAGAVLWFTLVPLTTWGAYWQSQVVVATVALAITSPVVALLILPFLVRYHAGGCPVLIWRAHGLVAAALSLLSFALTGLIALLVLGFTQHESWRASVPVMLYGAAWAVYLQMLRAAAVHRRRNHVDQRRLRATFT